jgi:hypothetical protein
MAIHSIYACVRTGANPVANTVFSSALFFQYLEKAKIRDILQEL